MPLLFSAQDTRWMARALQLAEQGRRSTAPNPRVGCVIAHGDLVVGEGWHQRAGEPHAEVHALAAAGVAAQGATAYVTLEPCSHTGRTPPCADALIRAGVSRVVVAMQDPNPLVGGQGLARLAAAGIATTVGVLEAEARELNRGFISRMVRGRPWVTVKLGASVDSKTALADGRSQWITSPAARADVQRMRAEVGAMLTGAGTVCADLPRLTVRDQPDARQPLRVVVDGVLRTPPHAPLYTDGGASCVATARPLTDPAAQRLLAQGVAVWSLPAAGGERVDLPALLTRLATDAQINEVLVEAGMGLAGALAAAGLVDEWVIYLAPMLVGHSGRGLVDFAPLPDLAAAPRLTWHDCRRVGDDMRLTLR